MRINPVLVVIFLLFAAPVFAGDELFRVEERIPKEPGIYGTGVSDPDAQLLNKLDKSNLNGNNSETPTAVENIQVPTDPLLGASGFGQLNRAGDATPVTVNPAGR